MNHNQSLDLNLAEQHYGNAFIKDLCFSRTLALPIDHDPLCIKNYLNAPTIVELCTKRNQSCKEKTRHAEAISYGDAGVYLSFPGPSLAGAAIEQMGNQSQQDRFFDYVKTAQCTTFAAITEPEHGSDLANIETTATKINDDLYSISGKKCFITHGFDGKIGITLARTGPGAFDIIGILLTEDELKNGEKTGSLKRELLPIIGLKGTCLSKIEFANFKVPTSNLLGQHLRLMQRGMLALIKTFNLMRPCVSGFVLGQAQGVIDYILTNISTTNNYLSRRMNDLNNEIYLTRNSLYEVADEVDHSPLEASNVSLLKAQITHLAEKICGLLIEELDPEIYFSHPLLMKWLRDCYGFEYMEGTTIIQKRNVYQKYLRSSIKRGGQ